MRKNGHTSAGRQRWRCDVQGRVLSWQWAASGNTQAYQALPGHVRRADAVCCDGAAGAIGAIRIRWPKARIQRCLVHVQRDGRRDLTAHPRTVPGRELREPCLRLGGIRGIKDAAQWAVDLHDWHERHRDFLLERSWATDDPTHPRALEGHTWWWTHLRVRRACFRLEHLTGDAMLFAFLDPQATVPGTIGATANMIEGGINAGLKRLLDLHRGLSQDHMRRAAEWYLYLHSRNPDPYRVLAGHPAAGDGTAPEPRPATDDRLGTGIQMPGANPDNIDAYEDGFGIRKGWVR
ncbi:IS3509a transposase [Bifidobacterium cuniculi]|uniref:IS3509a transposase n=2 Tax=Bifidobacterium cuniculi TaxID=1688 RepID=A0A087AQF1_9BIFI|nr:hypothetical protein [Bifidobacterium cuniculi]KFI61001.1 IS3509a transposase [Bifidobacterium cuniculi]